MSQAVGRQIESNKSSKDSTRSQDALELETLRRELEQLKVRVTELEGQLASNRNSGPPGRKNVARIYHSTGSVEEPPVLFCTGSSPKEHIKTAKKARKTNVVRAGRGFIWDPEYERGFFIRPNDLLTKKGQWMRLSFPKFRRRNELLAPINGNWHYMGTFAVVKVENISRDEWLALPDAMHEAVISFSGRAKKEGLFEGLLRQGKVGVSKYVIQRVGFDRVFATALLEASAAPVLEEQRDESDGSDD